jgi:hypothetical protein
MPANDRCVRQREAGLRLGVGIAQIARFGGIGCGIEPGCEPRHPGDVRSNRVPDLPRVQTQHRPLRAMRLRCRGCRSRCRRPAAPRLPAVNSQPGSRTVCVRGGDKDPDPVAAWRQEPPLQFGRAPWQRDMAMASSDPTPTTGTAKAKASPRAKATPTRMPAKEPGPTVTPIRSMAGRTTPAAASTDCRIAGSFSAWPRPIAGLSCARMRSPSPLWTGRRRNGWPNSRLRV